jgi:rRNA-processing protein FCF1
MVIRVILDTNFLVYCAEQKIDYAVDIQNLINEGYELITAPQVVEELKKIYTTSKKFSDRSAAFLALKILETNKVKVITSEGKYADDAIFNLVRVGSVVATLDLELRKRLEGRARVIVVKGQKKLSWE